MQPGKNLLLMSLILNFLRVPWGLTTQEKENYKPNEEYRNQG